MGMDMGWHGFYHDDENDRRKWQNPEAILHEIGLRPGQTFIDIGCGDGFFTIPAARIVGSSGRIYGLDSDPEAIRCLEERAEKEGLANLVSSVGKAEELVSCEACADFVFFGIVLHDFDDPFKVLMNARRMLKSTGCLVDVDWKKEPMKLGPPMSVKFSEQEAISLLEKANFKIDSVKKSGIYHYVIMAHQRPNYVLATSPQSAFNQDV
jgi:ubiquinone/menaquinone biosynthesis C-methylase UbiE